jgi:hypothetical protein
MEDRVMGDFSWDEVRMRRVAFAEAIGKLFCEGAKLKPTKECSPFKDRSMMQCYIYGEKIWDIAWYAVAEQLRLACGEKHSIIDHGWMIGFDDSIAEPWAMVVEPYADRNDVMAIAYKADKAMKSWGISVAVLGKEQSAWNPGNCVPVVAVLKKGMLDDFIKKAIMWVLRDTFDGDR